MQDSNGYLRISDELSRNTALNGYALYRVDTNLDGTVSLQGYSVIEYVEDVTITTDASALLVVNKGTTTQKISVNDDTQYMVKDGNTYDVYTGTANIPSIEDADVFYCDVNGDKIADYVYVKTGTLESMNGDHVLYVTEKSYSKVVDDTTYVMENVILDGVDNSQVTIATLADAEKLAAGQGKTFVATFTKGEVTNVALSTVTATAVATPEDSQVIYLGDAVTVKGNTMVGEYTDTSYRVNNAVVCGEDVALTTSDLEGYGVWVVYTDDAYNTVSHVYVGEALSENTGATVTVTYDTNKTMAATLDGITFKATLPDGATFAQWTAKANSNLAMVTPTSGTNATSDTFTVTAENGEKETYTVNVTAPAANQAMNMIESVTLNNDSHILTVPTSYETAADAVNDAVKITMTTDQTQKYDLTVTTKLVRGTTPAYGAIQGYGDKEAALACTLDETDASNALNGEHEFATVGEGYYIVIMTEVDGDVAYHAYYFGK